MLIDQPELRCPKCHKVIPDNQTVLESWDKQRISAENHGKAVPAKPTGISGGLLACMDCAMEASAGIPLPKKLTHIKNHPDQGIFDVPSVFIK